MINTLRQCPEYFTPAMRRSTVILLVIIFLLISSNTAESMPSISSLVFVFDVTGSMSPELDQVKREASKILNTLSDYQVKVIHDYIFVPFSDPNVGPIISTTNVTQFEATIRDIRVDGGGDCPEMCLTAIKQGLDNSLPKSYVFVFTDADPKDKHILFDVISLIRKKQSQITFLLTGNCESNHKSYPTEYEQIASISAGQIFSLFKSDISKVMEFIRLSYRSQKVNLLAVDFSSRRHSSKIYNITIDETITEFMISASGDNVNINVLPSFGERIDESSKKTFWLLELDSVKIIRFELPQPGTWNVNVSCTSSYSLRSTGSSVLSFAYGFSTKWTTNMNETVNMPFRGTKNYVFVESSNDASVGTMTMCELIALNGSSIDMIPLYSITNFTDFYYGSFVPNDVDFHLQISGITKQGIVFRRLTFPTLLSNASAIMVHVPENLTLKRYENYSFSCEIESAQPFEARWLRNGVQFHDKKSFNISGEIVIDFQNVSFENAGNYTCVVARERDSVSKSTSVRVIENPFLLQNISNHINLKLYDDYEVPCSGDGYPKPKITWIYNTSIELNVTQFNYHRLILPNNSLLLLNVLTNQSGLYSCVAENEAGKDFRYYNISVRTDTLNFTGQVLRIIEGQKAVFSCPGEQDIQWVKNNKPIDMKVNERADEPRFIIKGSKLKIVELDSSDSGTYSCSFVKSSRRYTWPFILQVLIPLSFRNDESHMEMSVKEHDNITLDCIVDGYPIPMITWKRKDFRWPINAWTMSDVTLNEANKQLLKFSSFRKVLHAGTYECTAENEISSVHKYFTLT